MKMLLDTHTFLWYYSGDTQLSTYAQKCLTNPSNEFWVSIVSMWEIAIKISIGKLTLSANFEDFCQDVIAKGFVFLPVELVHTQAVVSLPWHHRDPFDRLLVAQAISEKLNFVTADANIPLYFEQTGLEIIW